MKKVLSIVIALCLCQSLTAKTKLGYFFYTGRYTETDLLPILFRQRVHYKKSDIFSVGVTYPLSTSIRMIDFEAEGNLVKHSGIMSHLEANASLNARISQLFSLPISIAFGEGLSLASQNPRLENKRKGTYYSGFYLDWLSSLAFYQKLGVLPAGIEVQTNSIESSPILNFVMVELEYSMPQFPYRPAIFMRVHHRSGVFGLMCKPDPACGSNFISYGVRMWY